MAKKVEATVLDMYSFSETRPKLREVMISREQYLDLFDSQLEENRVLGDQGTVL